MKHNPALDAVRGLAIFAVVANHVGADMQGDLPPMAYSILSAGWLGVDIFFALSGFLIVSILLQEEGEAGWATRFLTRRARRILPLYIVVVLLPLAGLAWMGSRSDLPLWTYATFTVNFAMVLGHPDPRWLWFPQTWSLAVEEHFYLLWCLIMGIGGRRALLGMSVAVAVASPFIRLWACHALGTEAAYMLTFCRLDAMAYGTLVAWAVASGHTAFFRRVRWLLPVFAVGIGFMLPTTPVMLTLGLSVTGAGAALMVGVLASGVALRANTCLSGFPGLGYLGRRCYGVYLLHSLVVGAWGWGTRGLVDYPVWHLTVSLLGVLVTSLLVAEVSWRLIESPWLLPARSARSAFDPFGTSATDRG